MLTNRLDYRCAAALAAHKLENQAAMLRLLGFPLRVAKNYLWRLSISARQLQWRQYRFDLGAAFLQPGREDQLLA